MPFWVLQSEAQREHIAAKFLTQGGFTIYLPRIKIKIGARVRHAPLFPTYLFVQACARWYPARWTPHVTRILMAGEHPADLPDAVVTAIQRREGNDGFVRIPKNGLQLGQRVRVIKGALAGQLGIFEGMSGIERSRILIELLGRQTAVVLSSRDIVAVEMVATN